MPFVAIREDEGGRVYIDQYENPRQAFSGIEFYCQDCQAPMTIRMGDIVRAHFAHKPGYEDRPCCCLLYTSDAADERSSVDLGGRRIIKKKITKIIVGHS